MLLLLVGSAWLVGIFLSPQINLPWEASLLPGLGSIVVAGFYWNKPSIRLLGLAVLALTLGLVRYEVAVPRIDPGTVAYYADSGTVAVRGLVENEPEDRGVASVQVAARAIKVKEDWIEINGDIMARTGTLSDRRYGDLIQLTGELRSVSSSSDGAYADYLVRQGIYATMSYPKIEVLATNQAGPIYGWIHQLRDSVQKTLETAVPDPEAALLVGLLVGKRSSIPPELTKAFANTGTSHTLAISGWNISLVAGVLLLLGRRVLGCRALFVAGFGILVYTVFVGASPPVVRAAIMGLLYVSATLFGRRADVLGSLVLAGVVMTAWNPLVLWDVGFQLSFLATLGLIVLVPTFQKWFARLPRFLSESLSVTLAAEVFTLPLVVSYFSQVPLVAPLANFLIVPALPAAMLTGAATALTGMVFGPAGQLFGWLAWLSVTYIARVVELSAQLPGATLAVGNLPPVLFWLYYAALGLWLMSREYPPAKLAATRALSILRSRP